MNRLLFILPVFFLFSCKEPTPVKEKINPVGTWQSHVPWDNNNITVKVLPDSTMLFKVVKSFCPGTKYFISVGKWQVENDSFLVMKQFTDGRQLDFAKLFPELLQTQKDSANVITLALEARFIMDKDHLYDVEPDSTRSKTRYYDRK
jgi:hypothetical protein